MHSNPEDKYTIHDVDFTSIHNRNERRVLKALKQIIDEERPLLTPKDIQDIYALTLNKIPAHYVHSGTIVLRANIRQESIIAVIKENIAHVQNLSKP